jgi:hypothetical protein
VGEEGVKFKLQNKLVEGQVFATQDEGSNPSASTKLRDQIATTIHLSE